MITRRVALRLNEQLNLEYFSAYLYLSMSAYSLYLGLRGFAHWFKLQYAEEVEHAMKIFNYLDDQGSRIELFAIQQPRRDFGSALDLFQISFSH